MNRRRWMNGLVAAGVGAAAVGLYTWRVEPHWLEMTRRKLAARGLPKELEGRTLAQLSDLHIGPSVDDDYIWDSFERVRKESPDFVAFTGDWITYRGPRQLEQLKQLSKYFPKGKLGTLGILGNHDYGFHWQMGDVAEEVATIVRRAGIPLLRNETITMAGLQFVGMDDFWGTNFDPAAALATRQPELPTIVLCHNPDAADEAVWGGYEGWILAGHTHGGQCKPPFLPPPLLPVRNRRYTSGEFELSGKRQMYISRGVGHLLRVRFNVRPEIAMFELTGAT